MSREDVLRRFRNFQEARDTRRAKLPEAARAALGNVRIENQADSTDYTLWIDDEIGGWWGITARDFAASMRQVPANASLTIMVDSPGGSIFEATPIYNLIKRHEGNVTADIYGMAGSAASFIALAANKVRMARNGRMMIHDAQAEAYAYGDEAVMREHINDVSEVADLLDSISNTIADMYMQKAGGTIAQWRNKMRQTTWYDSSEALSAGLVDEIEGGAPGTAPTDQLDPELFNILTIPAPEFSFDGLRDALKGVFQ